MKTINVFVGPDSDYNCGYQTSAEKLIQNLREFIYHRKEADFAVNDPRVVAALQYLHKVGEYEITLWHENKPFNLDINGQLIQPWPDDFFEVEFYIRFM